MNTPTNTEPEQADQDEGAAPDKTTDPHQNNTTPDTKTDHSPIHHLPLENEKYETYAKARGLKGFTKRAAYRLICKKSTKTTALGAGAYRLEKMPDVQARIAFWEAHREAVKGTDIEKTILSEPANGKPNLRTKEGRIQRFIQLANDPDLSDKDAIAALNKLSEIYGDKKPDEDGTRPDPAALGAWIARLNRQGKEPGPALIDEHGTLGAAEIVLTSIDVTLDQLHEHLIARDGRGRTR